MTRRHGDAEENPTERLGERTGTGIRNAERRRRSKAKILQSSQGDAEKTWNAEKVKISLAQRRQDAKKELVWGKLF